MIGILELIAGWMDHACLFEYGSVDLVLILEMRMIGVGIILYCGLLVIALIHGKILDFAVDHEGFQVLLHGMMAFNITDWHYTNDFT